jgi:uncharacterized protein
LRGALLLLLLLGAAGCEARSDTAVANPAAPAFPKLTGRVVDAADLLPPAAETALTARAAALEREAGAQFVVVTVPDLQGRSIEDYGYQLGRHWGIGSKERDDGVLLIVAPGERKVRIEVGYGLEKRVTDPFAAKVIEQILPEFRSGDFAAGVAEASEAIAARIGSKATNAEILKADGVIPW